ncbi:thioredoxin fold domain-containing protein [Pseudomonas aeruginosa]
MQNNKSEVESFWKKKNRLSTIRDIAIIVAVGAIAYKSLFGNDIQQASAPQAEPHVEVKPDRQITEAYRSNLTDLAKLRRFEEMTPEQQQEALIAKLKERAAQIDSAGPVVLSPKVVQGVASRREVASQSPTTPAADHTQTPPQTAVPQPSGQPKVTVNDSPVKSTLHPAPFVDQEAAASLEAKRKAFEAARAADPSKIPVVKIGYHNDGSAMSPAEKAENIRETLARIPDEWTLNYQAPNERARIYVFSDITCPYCQKLHHSMQQFLDAGISVHYLLYPRDMAANPGQLTPTTSSMINIWCSVDQQAALNDAFMQYKPRPANCADLPEGVARIKPPIADHFRIGDMFGVQGTPTIFASNGASDAGFTNFETTVARLGL